MNDLKHEIGGRDMPGLVVSYPYCACCYTDVLIEDDSAFCNTCEIWWPQIYDGAPAQPIDPDEAKCGTSPNHASASIPDSNLNPCSLPKGHDGPCWHQMFLNPPKGGGDDG
jgi:hypothetical protein